VKLVDLNVLLYAVNRDADHHAAAREWWEQALRAEEPVGLTRNVLLGFLRLSTNPDAARGSSCRQAVDMKEFGR
jgi:predicted nucleic acid-binding protein